MDKKETAYLLQRIDCNCNDCGFLKRDLERLNAVRSQSDINQKWFFEQWKIRTTQKAKDWQSKGHQEKAETLLKLVAGAKYQYQPPLAEILYGHCGKFNTSISFIPNTCQITTQKCFVHRKDFVQN